VTEGEGTITDNEGNTEQVKAGDTLLFPASTHQLRFTGNMTFLETYV
jgi:mannose-6-phosphate isomerase